MEKYIESETLELKEKFTENIAKEIVSFLNGNGGTILVGVKDDGSVVGVSKIDETSRKISDIITTQIEPNPQDEIELKLKKESNKKIIVININKGSRDIYCQKKYGFSSSGCTIRIGTTCKEMTPEQIKNRYEKKFIDLEYMLKKRASLDDLSFRELKIYYSEKGYHLEDRSFERNLNLRNDEGRYNLLAELLSDKNNIPFIFVKFKGKNKATISERVDYGHGCLLTTYEKIKTRLKSENISITDTTKRPRKDINLFDYDAVNEAVLNALIHNDWTITEPQISFFNDRMEILSHGGLPLGMDKKQFFDGISKPRNTTLMRIFLNMGLAEHTGHGIPTIIEKYGEKAFEIENNYIRCTIPFEKKVMEKNDSKNVGLNVGMNVGMNVGLNKIEKKLLELLLSRPNLTSAEISKEIKETRRAVENAFKSLQEKEIIIKGRSKNISINVGKNIGRNVLLNQTEKSVLELLANNSNLTSVEISEELGVTKRTVERAFKSLQEKKLLIRVGSRRDGAWIVNI